MIFAGNLKENLTILRIEETQSKSGYKQQSEVELFTVKAERTKNKENYGVDAGELFHSNELTFRCRKGTFGKPTLSDITVNATE